MYNIEIRGPPLPPFLPLWLPSPPSTPPLPLHLEFPAVLWSESEPSRELFFLEDKTTEGASDGNRPSVGRRRRRRRRRRRKRRRRQVEDSLNHFQIDTEAMKGAKIKTQKWGQHFRIHNNNYYNYNINNQRWWRRQKEREREREGGAGGRGETKIVIYKADWERGEKNANGSFNYKCTHAI